MAKSLAKSQPSVMESDGFIAEDFKGTTCFSTLLMKVQASLLTPSMLQASPLILPMLQASLLILLMKVQASPLTLPML